MRWGLVPSWAKDPTVGNRMINARAETVGENPSFRQALVKRRCLIPADGFTLLADPGLLPPYPVIRGSMNSRVFCTSGMVSSMFL